MKNIAPGVWTWSDVAEDKGYALNGWLLQLAGGAVVIDPAHFEREPVDVLTPLAPIVKIYLTNRDHERASAAVREKFGAPVAVHEADAPLLQVAPQESFRDGDVLSGALQAVHLPDQKSPGECAFWWPERRILFVGDAVIGHPPGTLSMLPPEKFKDCAKAKAGLRRLLDFPFQVLLLGDGASQLSGGRSALEQFLGPAR